MSSALLTHRVVGDGPAVAFANGGMMTLPSWEPIAAPLRLRHRTLLFDFRGQLLSPGEPPADLAGHAADWAALLAATGCAPAHLVATSFGALVALELAARHPERVRSLLLITAMPRATEVFRRQGEAMRAVLAGILAGGERGRFYDLLVDGVYSASYRRREAELLAVRRGQIDQVPLAWFAGVDRLLATLDGFDLRPRLPAVRCPARLILAADDQVMDAFESRTLAAAIGADVVVHPTSGHGLVAEDPEWLAAECAAFLERVEPAPGPERSR